MERAFRPRRNKKPATATSRIATAERTSLPYFGRDRLADAAEETCAGRAAAAAEDPPTLGEGGVCADTPCAEGAPCGARCGSATTAALLPDSVSRFNLWRSA